MDALILGSGPAGLGIASVLAKAGRSVQVIAPAPLAAWPQGYGAWGDELEGWQGVIDRRWPDTRAGFGGATRVLGRAYARLDNTQLRAALEGPYLYTPGRVGSVDPLAGQVTTEDGTVWSAALIVDASGADSLFLPVPPGRGPGTQMAYGRLLDVEAHPFGDEALLMDFDDLHLEGELEAATISSFLYALPFGPRRVFVEETSLVARPPVGLDLLEARLDRRLAALGVRGETVSVERCRIPMGRPRPRPVGRMVAFGAAASMVHPASGYLLGQVLQALPRLEAAMPGDREGLPARVAEAIWPAERAQAHDLYCFGMEVLLTLSPGQTRAFFEAFFELPRPLWEGYLSGRLSISGMASAMARVFGAVPFSVQAEIARRGLSGPRDLLWRGLFGA